jgi:addiction module HigA family antidote
MGLSISKLAIDLRMPLTRIADIVHDRRGITTETAPRLARYFRNPPVFWLHLQVRYDLEVAEHRLAARVARDGRPSPLARFA